MTIRQRSAGVYNCTVSNARVEDGTITVNGTTVTASPGFATVILIGMYYYRSIKSNKFVL